MEELIELHSEVKQYAVYAHWYKGKCFYVGCGIYHRDNISKSRAYNFTKRSPDWFNYCNGETYKIKVKILFTTNDRKLAFDKEGELTKTYVEKGYKLTNKDFGTYPSDETRNKISKALKGRKHSEEARKRMSLAQKGIKHSEESKKRMSLAKKGENNPMYGVPSPFKGKKHSIKSRQKMSKKLKGKTPWNKGVTPTQETIDKIKKAKRNTKNHKQWVKVKVIFPNGDEKICKSITEAGKVADVKNAKYLSKAEKTCKKTGIRMERV